MTSCRVLYLSDPPMRTQICREYSPTVYFESHLFQVFFGNSGIHKMVSSRRELGPVQNTTMNFFEYRGLYTNWFLTHPHDPPPYPSLYSHTHPHPPTPIQTPFTHCLCRAPNLGSQVDHLLNCYSKYNTPTSVRTSCSDGLEAPCPGGVKVWKKRATGC